MTTVDSGLGLGDPAFFATDPDPVLASMRAECPVAWLDSAGFWALTRHRDVQAVSSDPLTFSSQSGVLISDRGRAVAAADSLLYLDPPRHVAHRKLINRAFTPRRVATLEARIQDLTVELLDAIDPTQPVDVVDAVTAPLPLLVIAELLGIPAQDRDSFRRWSDAVMSAATEITRDNATLAMELIVYLDAALNDRVERPRDDLLSALLAAEVDGERLTRQELLGFGMTLLVAGNETTRGLLTGGLLALAEWPAERARLVEEPALLGTAVEEMLRWVTPIMAMSRTATNDVEISGCPVASGDYVVMAYGAANRDDEVFADADRFDVARTPNPHLAFGFGGHFCIGAGLARLEAEVFFRELLSRWPDYQVVGDVERVPSTLLRQIGSMQVLLQH